MEPPQDEPITTGIIRGFYFLGSFRGSGLIEADTEPGAEAEAKAEVKADAEP